MKAIILVAGYATRLYPLTENTPKPLLKVAGKPMIDHIMNKIHEVEDVSGIYIVANNKFAQDFIGWKQKFNSKANIEVINDGTENNDDRLGAIGDIQFAIEKGKINEDILVVAGDNLFEFPLADAVDIFKEKKSNVIVLYDVKEFGLAKNYGVVSVNNGILSDFVEKPENPKSTLVSTGIYLFPKKILPLIERYIQEGNSTDKSGSFIEWLYNKEKVYAFITEKSWYDIGTFEQLEKADKEFEGK